MRIEYLQTFKPRDLKSEAKDASTDSFSIENHLVGLEGTVHNGSATQLLCAAATWAYSDLKTFAAMMQVRGLYGEFVGINIVNQPAFIDTTVYLFVSEPSQWSDEEERSRKLAILTYRGTGVTNLANWLMDARTAMEPQEEGSIHGGFLTASIVALPLLRSLLLEWTNNKSLRETLCMLREKSGKPLELFPENIDNKKPTRTTTEADHDNPPTHLRTDSLPHKQALYICGHSLGGAFASMSAAILCLEPSLKPLMQRLRSVYTFGQPMFADKTLANTLQAKIGDRVFRHSYRKDIVPRLPPRIMGDFYHFGCNYAESKGVWLRRQEAQRPLFGFLASNLIGVLAIVKEQVPLLQWLSLPFSWGDHSPLHYMRTSQAPRSGWEILGPELTGTNVGQHVTPRSVRGEHFRTSLGRFHKKADS